ncbi:hypothetical protein OKW21_001366 [Catalinimonas alkaloidigena]|uniref:hypothetical protein n=1 Tax=Catalinimonas alkaloidigena TaxID=1075417 RepID=UPI0024052DF1|nr:hypothetical protein [Catalinimonas alkaloidigena]MDF9796103.1 hypothetical protein [Catalinimonas alkaloidigena]
MLAIFEDLLSQPEGWVLPGKTLTIYGIIRTYGIGYVLKQDILLFTDVGEPASDAD